ncbi:E3 ubiquitin-protein ligase MPSR1-like [Salvia miltiorrhiza]|uniref:E3 ubiquitin-protein ligase MPSR1-like n=1 Tax=Salvia miltiorrhiza TaxID=226208 RepID=UPI0025ACE551|nr:E3 ubiquitin-protein ligase MPSR1-like [Salvia miltiorrhiza]
MASEAASPDQLGEIPSNSSGGGIPFFLPFLFAAAAAAPDAHDQPWLVFIDALIPAVVVAEGGGGSNASFDDLLPPKAGRRAASKASIDAMPTVEVASGEDSGSSEQCAVCLEGWEGGETAREMPCKHRFHGGCIERWLSISGSCPVCRYQMPEEEEEEKNRDERGRRRGVWVSFSFGGDRSSVDGENRESNE